jgi:hypothetical protein
MEVSIRSKLICASCREDDRPEISTAYIRNVQLASAAAKK